VLTRFIGCLCLLTALSHAAPAYSEVSADAVLLDGKIVTFDSATAEALAVRGGRITAIGRSADIRTLAGPATRVIDLAGRTVIPGLIDSHIHAIRAGLTYNTEVHWIGARSIPEALERLRVAAQIAPKGSWLVVAGGWVEGQFDERRRPTQAEVAAAAGDHPVYVQLLYSAVLLTPAGSRRSKSRATPSSPRA
jgi:predicted amidohydrolase YtcJ